MSIMVLCFLQDKFISHCCTIIQGVSESLPMLERFRDLKLLVTQAPDGWVCIVHNAPFKSWSHIPDHLRTIKKFATMASHFLPTDKI